MKNPLNTFIQSYPALVCILSMVFITLSAITTFMLFLGARYSLEADTLVPIEMLIVTLALAGISLFFVYPACKHLNNESVFESTDLATFTSLFYIAGFLLTFFASLPIIGLHEHRAESTDRLSYQNFSQDYYAAITGYTKNPNPSTEKKFREYKETFDTTFKDKYKNDSVLLTKVLEKRENEYALLRTYDEKIDELVTLRKHIHEDTIAPSIRVYRDLKNIPKPDSLVAPKGYVSALLQQDSVSEDLREYISKDSVALNTTLQTKYEKLLVLKEDTVLDLIEHTPKQDTKTTVLLQTLLAEE